MLSIHFLLFRFSFQRLLKERDITNTVLCNQSTVLVINMVTNFLSLFTHLVLTLLLEYNYFIGLNDFGPIHILCCDVKNNRTILMLKYNRHWYCNLYCYNYNMLWWQKYHTNTIKISFIQAFMHQKDVINSCIKGKTKYYCFGW